MFQCHAETSHYTTYHIKWLFTQHWVEIGWSSKQWNHAAIWTLVNLNVYTLFKRSEGIVFGDLTITLKSSLLAVTKKSLVFLFLLIQQIVTLWETLVLDILPFQSSVSILWWNQSFNFVMKLHYVSYWMTGSRKIELK